MSSVSRHHRGAAIKPLTCSSFLGYPSSSLLLRQSFHYQHFQKTSTLSMVFERMSEDCIGAIVTAQKEAYKLGLEHVEPPVLLAGICDRPERTKPTLERYQITWRKTTRALSQAYPDVTDDSVSLSKFFQQAKQDLPFSKPLRECMVQAGQIANQMGSTTIHSQHVFLALLSMKEKPTTDSSSSSSSSSVTVMQVLHKMVDPSLTSDDVYKTLLQDLQQADEKELLLVAAGKESGTSGSSSTPTLEEVGTDLTLLAQQGRLDVVQGRDEEIKSCLRTLVRRRKNNPGTVPYMMIAVCDYEYSKCMCTNENNIFFLVRVFLSIL
jgi:ATP-dependent Clp protease ATP-binding subunit ClpC